MKIAALVVRPTLAAFTMTGAAEGREGVLRLLRRVVLWRVVLGWRLIGLLGTSAIILLSTAVVPWSLA